MDESTALVHLPALLLFYALQYFVLKTHMPQAAPWIAVATLAAVAALVSLLILGVAFYSGGLLYQRISKDSASPAAKAV